MAIGMENVHIIKGGTHMKKWGALLLASVTAAMLLTACGGGNAESTEAASGVAETEVASIAETRAEAPEAAEDWDESQATEDLVIHISSAAHSLSKWATTAGDMLTDICYLVFDPVLMMEEDGSISPWLAEEYEMAEDGMQITMKLREDVYFTNGSHFTADDLAYTFEQVRDDEEHYPDAITKNWRDFLGDIEVVDDYNIVINFVKPMPEFWSLIVDNSLQVIDKETMEEIGWDAYFAAPIGTGPYEFSEVDLANSVFKLTLRSDEHGYWGYDYTNSHTNVKNITIMTSSESQTRISSLRTGEVDIIDAVPTSDIAGLQNESNIIQLNPNQSVFLEFNSAPGKAFNDQKLREALSLCIDRQAIVEALLDGYGIAGLHPCLEGNLGYRDEYTYEYDLERAAQLVEESGYNGEPLRFIYTTSTVAIANELCGAIQQMAQQIGINFELVPQDVAVFDAERLEGNCDICLSAIVKSGNMWYKTAANVIGDDRFNSGCDNEELRQLGTDIQTILDEDVMDEKLAQMYEIQFEDFDPVLYLYYPTLIAATQKNVTGILSHNRHYLDCSRVVLVD